MRLEIESCMKFIEAKNIIRMKNWQMIFLVLFHYAICIIGPWMSLTLTEKIILCASAYIYFIFAIFYTSKERMDNLTKKNAFCGWSMFILGIFLIYSVVRNEFGKYSWILIIVLVGNHIAQSILFIKGLDLNIKNDYYEGKAINIRIANSVIDKYNIVQIILHIFVIGLTNIVLEINNCSNKVQVFINYQLIFVFLFYLLGLLLIYQNYIIKKYNLYYFCELLVEKNNKTKK